MKSKTTGVRPYATGRACQPAPARRKFLARGARAAGALALGGAGAISHTAQAQIAAPDWMKTPGAASPGYGQPSKFEAKVHRVWATVQFRIRLRPRLRRRIG